MSLGPDPRHSAMMGGREPPPCEPDRLLPHNPGHPQVCLSPFLQEARAAPWYLGPRTPGMTLLWFPSLAWDQLLSRS